MRISTIAVLLLTAVLAFSANAEISVGVFSNSSGNSTCANIESPSQVLYVVYKDPSANPIKSIQFTASAPLCLHNSMILDESVFPGTIGGSQAGVYIDFGECLVPPIHVLTINVIGGNVVENCCWWPFTDIQIVDCNDEVIGVGSSGGMLSIEPCELTAPHSPFPADDAVGLPATVLFNWLTENPPVECYGTPLVYNIYIGTDPESLDQHWWIGPPYEVNGLLPGTRYYWQADVEILGTEGPYISPLWSFVTEGAVPVEQSTWGRIKSLFR